MKKIIQQLIIALIMLVPGLSFADETGLPNVLNGQTTVTTSRGDVFYGGLGANQQILNWQPDYIAGLQWANNNNTILRRCAASTDIVGLVPCLILTSPTNSVDIMRSYTYRDGSVDLETIVVIAPTNTVIGDVYGGSNTLPLFKQFGKHLNTTGGSGNSSAYYNIGNYQFNKQAQSFWDPDDANKNAAMTETINRLLANAKPLNTTFMSGSFNGICGPNVSDSDPACKQELHQYPNGRVWQTDHNLDIGIDPTYTLNYTHSSTIIIGDGNTQASLTIDAGIFDSISGADTSSLGFIVRNGSVTIKNSSGNQKKINAHFFVPNGDIFIEGSNITFTGSYTARNFLTR